MMFSRIEKYQRLGTVDQNLGSSLCRKGIYRRTCNFWFSDLAVLRALDSRERKYRLAGIFWNLKKICLLNERIFRLLLFAVGTYSYVYSIFVNLLV